MKTTHSDERELNESPIRHAVPVLVWAALFAFFAVGGALSREEPTHLVNAAPAVQLMADDDVDVPAIALNAPSARDPAQPDPVIVAHEALDPVGVGLNAAR